MEKASSTHAAPECINNLAPNGGPMFAPDSSASGRKTTSGTTSVEDFVLVDNKTGAVELVTTTAPAVLVEEEESSEEESLSSEEEESDWESDDEEEEDEEWNERLRVLEDARNLKKVAGFFLHPEAPVECTSPVASARCYFERASAPPVVTLEEAEEQATVMEELAMLKQQAVDFLHPEKPVAVTDVAACGRNFFSRPSAPEYEDDEDDDAMEEHELILQDLRKLKQVAVDYLHPEKPVDMGASLNSARCYFDRASAPERETFGAAEERARILQEAQQCKAQAMAYAHPELPLEVDRATVTARNYFTRPSAPEYDQDEDDAEERARVLAEAKAFKAQAVAFAHPELPLEVDAAFCTARNYFMRPSAPEQETFGAAEERARVLAEAQQLKAQSVLYAHPEAPLVVDATASARNYFARPSAPEQETFGASEERARVLAEAKAFKSRAEMFAHPERPLQIDAASSARCFFDRPSAPDKDTFGAAEERARILAESKALKSQAELYAHPERPLQVDAMATARCYFDRVSAVVQESPEEVQERLAVLAEAKALKSQAELYAHPERPVLVDGTVSTARCYFDRASAPQQEPVEEAQERAAILADLKALKSQAVDYMHPERPVVVDATAAARNYFTRASAPVQQDVEEAQERAQVLADAASLKKLAVDYLHPERSVVTSDPTATGRNYFDRASAHGHDQMVHTFPVHEDDLHQEEHHDEFVHDHEWDHFGMDEDMDHMFDDMRHDLSLPDDSKKGAAATVTTAKASSNVINKSADGSDEEGKLSRSPSSVMLFTGEAVN